MNLLMNCNNPALKEKRKLGMAQTLNEMDEILVNATIASFSAVPFLTNNGPLWSSLLYPKNASVPTHSHFRRTMKRNLKVKCIAATITSTRCL